jgi:NADP-dependent 3-hydroxy acid dehydrogenase YdfG
MAHILFQAGARMGICSRSWPEIEAAATELTAETGGTVEPLVSDVSVRSQAERLVADALARLGKVDILISNAGWNIPQPADKIRDEDGDALMELNVSSFNTAFAWHAKMAGNTPNELSASCACIFIRKRLWR